ncbi:MAG: hypothetical protein IT428_31510 [Planctomycetaceae bacterium]|nr:hypothetical protein [Planctomycetaceae bacterium]
MNRGRAIFRFWDGQRDRLADPMVIHRSLLEHGEFNWETTPALIDVDNDKISSDALRITADATRKAFGVPELIDGGLTETELLQLLVQFSLYLSSLKKSISPPQTSPAATAPKPSGNSTTKPASDSGSTCDASKPVAVTG